MDYFSALPPSCVKKKKNKLDGYYVRIYTYLVAGKNDDKIYPRRLWTNAGRTAVARHACDVNGQMESETDGLSNERRQTNETPTHPGTRCDERQPRRERRNDETRADAPDSEEQL